MSLQLCILETDDLHPDLMDPFIGYGQMFSDLFSDQGIEVQCSVFNVLHGQYPAPGSQYQAYVVTGSKADAFADDPWILRLRAFLLDRYQAGDKLLGICFGHQLLAHTLGGQVGRSDKGWGIGVQQYQLQQQHDWMQPALTQLQLQASHQDQVHVLPENAQCLASSAFCNNAAFVIGQQVLCFQGHPEFAEGYAQALLDLRRRALGEEPYRRAAASLSQTAHHGRIVGRWLLNFVSQR
jgi:GMP synthase-like glutamine amidotransferase